ncbi:MAG TPA: glutamate 2,3-aminomutase [Clostridia bacterium]|jgi:glutamate 2,3-aminomutase|nr:glutamate 2,3-aminomutase [Clostridia bacterium]
MGQALYHYNEKRSRALERAKELKSIIEDYLETSKTIKTGLLMADQIDYQKKKILQYLNATEEDWQDWNWQMDNRFETASALSHIINLSQKEIEEIDRVSQQFRWAASPYYVSLMDPDDPECPVRKQAVPSILELSDDNGTEDPMNEEYTSPAPCITRRYPDRLIINVTNQCAMYCRHCQRRRNIGEVDEPKSMLELEAAIKYIADNPEIRDVLITGGDAFMLGEEKLEWLLSKLHRIDHVEIVRFGTRTLVTMPQRITDDLCAVLEKYPPIYVNTQFNHPREITKDVHRAAEKLVKAGVPLGNQTVLLRNINNNPHIMKKLNHELLKARIKPYYIFHAKAVKGTSHFITKVETGIEIMEKLRGFTSGLAIPEYIVNAPGGYGKIPMQPMYRISAGSDYIMIRTWEGKTIKYNNSGKD